MSYKELLPKIATFRYNAMRMLQLNAFHTISITGIIFSLFSHILLLIFDKTITNFWYLYPTWVLVFLFGYLWNVIDKTEDGHHHH